LVNNNKQKTLLSFNIYYNLVLGHIFFNNFLFQNIVARVRCRDDRPPSCMDIYLVNMGRQGILCLLAMRKWNGSRHLVFWSLETLTGLRDRVRRLIA